MEKGVNWGDVATWVTGIATIALFVVGFIQIRIERSERTKRDREAKHHKIREQAEQISSWIVKETTKDYKAWIAVLNQSTLPVYQVIVCLVMVQGSGPRDGINAQPQYRSCLSVAPPGQVFTSLPADYHGMNRRAGIEFAFKDAAGNSWLRKSNGDLSQIDKSPVEYYNLSHPLSWCFPEPNIPQD